MWGWGVPTFMWFVFPYHLMALSHKQGSSRISRKAK